MTHIEIPLAAYEAHEDLECPSDCPLCAHEDALMQAAFKDAIENEQDLVEL